MKHCFPIPAATVLLSLVFVTSIATAATAKLPDTAVGKLAGELIRHANVDSPAQIRQWVPGILAASVSADDKSDFIAGLVSAVRDEGGVEVFDVRTDPRQPGLLEVAVKGRRNAQAALFWLVVDPAHPDRLAEVHLVGMDNPLYADWPKGPVSHAELRTLINTALDRLVSTSDFSGCVTVADGGKTVFDECRGLADRNFHVPIDQQTKFHIGSVGKMFTAVAIAQLVEAGKLSWDDTLAKLVPEYPDHATAKQITVWELLHHTSGLGDFMVPEYFEHAKRYVNPVDYLGLIARQPLAGPPGKLNYSNAGYILLGRIIENVSGENYFDYIRHHVFEPAQMTSSGFDSKDEIVPGLAVGYYHDDGVFSRTWKADWVQNVYKGSPAGGGYSTNTDLLRFAKALHSGKLLKSATLMKMFDGEVPNNGPGAIAAGFGERLSHGRHIRGHQGGIEGTTADLEMVWETGAAVVLTSNEGPSQHWLLAEKIADLLAAEGTEH